MSSFASFSQFIHHGGQASIILRLRPAEPLLELKQSWPDPSSVDAFEQRLRGLAAENWSGIAAAFLRAGLEVDPAAEDIEAEVDQARATYSDQASAILASGDPSVFETDLETLANWLARRFQTEINERRQRQLGVTHFIWRTQDDEKVRAAHAERDDRVFSWEDGFPDGAPGHGYNCRCVAEPAIIDGTILLTGVPASPEISDRIARAQASGLADAATDATVGGATSVYNLVRFSWLGYRRLFGIITPEEEAERLAMREGVLRAIDALAALDEETLRQLADAFVDHFEAQHADLRLLDLEYRLGLVSEETLLQAYQDVAYMDGATTLSTTAFATVATRLGLNLTRLRPRDAFVALRAATARMETLLAMRRTTASAFVARRFAELEAQGHGPQRHEGAVTRQMLIDRVLDGKDPMTGTSVDGVTGRPHRPPPIATRITTPEAFVAAESYLRRTAAYRAARDAAFFRAHVPARQLLGHSVVGRCTWAGLPATRRRGKTRGWTHCGRRFRGRIAAGHISIGAKWCPRSCHHVSCREVKLVSLDSWKETMFLLCGPETYDPDSLKEGLAENSIEARDFRTRFEAILRDRPLGAREYERDIGFHFDTDEQLYRYLAAMHAFLFESGPFPL